jgi:hypothetical protein
LITPKAKLPVKVDCGMIDPARQAVNGIVQSLAIVSVYPRAAGDRCGPQTLLSLAPELRERYADIFRRVGLGHQEWPSWSHVCKGPLLTENERPIPKQAAPAPSWSSLLPRAPSEAQQQPIRDLRAMDDESFRVA